MALVYVVTNIVNGHKYVGYTSKTLEMRTSQHFWFADKKPTMVFSRAIKKYGRDNFNFETVKGGISIEEAAQIERDLIAELKPEYNVSAGGKNPFHGVAWTEERRQLMSVKRKGWRHSPETRARMKIVQNTWDRSAYCKAVICLDDGVIYPSTRHAANAYGLKNKDRVINVCCGFQASANGKHFAYYEEGFSEDDRIGLLTAAIRKKERQRDACVEARKRDVVCVVDGERYPSVVSAAQAYGISVVHMFALLKTGSATRKGLRFAYAVEKAA